MKNILLLLAVLISSEFSFGSGNSTSSANETDNIKEYKVKTGIYNRGSKIKKATIKVFSGSELVDVIFVSNKKDIELTLPHTEYGTIEVSKEGYHDRRVVFSTSNGAAEFAKRDIKLEIELYSKAELLNTDPNLVDFPAAILTTNDKHELVSDSEYNESLFDEFETLIEEELIPSLDKTENDMVNQEEKEEDENDIKKGTGLFSKKLYGFRSK